ncbi:MAG: MinD/ParA family protein [bacterium]|nr:MinD/ParA family protein [bacterium]
MKNKLGTLVSEHDEDGAEIWAVGGGKGGTGKTFVVTQLAIYLASRGNRVIIVDTDFGGPNIHSFFGVKRTGKTINDFIEQKQPLQELVIESGIKNLAFIPGTYQSVDSENMNYLQKTKLFRHIRKLSADYILLDLGGGTSNDTIDTFLLADRMILVTVPEITAIENLFQFVKSSFFRKLRFLLGIYGLKDTIRDIWKNRKEHGIRTIVDLLEHVKNTSDQVSDILTKEMDDFSFFVILNKVRNSMEIREGFSIRSICIKHVGVETMYAGYVEYDFQFWKNLSLIQNTPRLNVSPSVKKDIKKIAENIINLEQMKISSLKNARK